jgi:hypothetical protein
MTVANLWYSATSPAPFVVHLLPPIPISISICISMFFSRVGRGVRALLSCLPLSLSPSLPSLSLWDL